MTPTTVPAPLAGTRRSWGDRAFRSVTLASGLVVLLVLVLIAATINDDLTFSPLNEAGATTYPITSPTWILVYKNQTDATKAAVLKAYLAYALGAGQQLAAQSYYSALPQSLDQKAVAQIAQITVGS
ncbi:MAG TPA: hypothetical protein VGI86_00155 [Acidimicrobiia bacterium]